MRVLLLHNRYRAAGGEERAVAEITALLARRGHAAELFERSSADIGPARAARGLLSGGIAPREVGDLVRRTRAEVVHAHNLHPLFGWRSLAAAREAGARTVLHVHNFRLFCAIAVAYRDGAPCFRCRGRDTLPGLRLRCRGSLAEAAVYAAGLHLQQPRIVDQVDRFIVVSEAHAARLHELGLPANRSTTLPNFLPAASFATESAADAGRYAMVAGRLVEEKGYDVAIRAARAAGVPLLVAGEGPDAERLRRLAGDADVRFVGRLAPAELASARADAGILLAPSRCEEACPYSVLEAAAAGVPVIGSDRGGIPELVGPELTVPAEDTDAWSAALEWLWRDPEVRRERGDTALARARERFGEALYYERLMALYGSL